MSKWKKFGMTEKILKILDVQSYLPGHHFGRPFLTPYQIAIEFRSRYLKEFAELQMPVGGKGTGLHYSLSQYIARQLSERIKAKDIKMIEGGFLYREHVKDLRYVDPNAESKETGDVISSLGQSYDLSMFRLKD